MRYFVIQSEKILYYTLDKTNFKQKLNQNSEYYFGDSTDTLVCCDLYNQLQNLDLQKFASIYNIQDKSIILIAD